MTPTVGQLATDGLTVHYRAPEDYLGPDSFTVIVSDSGVPSMSAEIGFTVEVVPPEEGGCGCQTSSGRQGATTILLLFLAALVPLARRHRRR
jgi:MYXO-CTERM domain-containing protein